MHDQFKKRFRTSGHNPRLRQQIATEAARRMFAAIGPTDARGHLRDADPSEYYVAKRKAAAVLGHRVRPGDLPSDAEVREQVLALARAQAGQPVVAPDEPDAGEGRLEHLADHVDRFAIYRMRLLPLEEVKQDPRHHPEGDALYHSLQVFERAREARPYDEEFLLAALLHDVGKAIDPADHVAAGLDALRGTLTDRAAWLVEHHMDLLPGRKGAARMREALAASEWFDDLVLLRELDDAGRVAGVPVGTVDEALAYLRGLEDEAYLDG